MGGPTGSPLQLTQDLIKNYKNKVNPKWKSGFDNYMKTVPSYYMPYMKRALARMGYGGVLNDTPEIPLNYSVSTNLKKFKNQAKVELDRLIASVGQKVPSQEGIVVEPRTKASILQRKDFNQLLKNNGSDLAGMTQEMQDFTKFTVAVKNKSIQPQYYRNPYDISRDALLDQVRRMRTNFLQPKSSRSKVIDDDQLHSVPVQQMGNYQEYLKKQPPPLKELESQPVRLHTFGNPFKVKQDMMIDEADDAAFVGQSARNKRSMPSHPSSPGPKKKKPGPLSRDVPMRRPSSPHPGSLSPMSSSESVGSDSDSENELMIVESEDEGEGELVNGEQQQQQQQQQQQNHQYVFGGSAEMGPPHPAPHRALADPTGKKLAVVCANNRKLKMAVFREVKKPGRNHEKLFSHLRNVQGGFEARRAFVQETIVEASRFKRKTLIQMLEQFLQKMMQSESKRGNRTNSVSRSNLNVQR